MALSIKDRETELLARRLAERTGESITVATKRALEERLRRMGSDARKAALAGGPGGNSQPLERPARARRPSARRDHWVRRERNPFLMVIDASVIAAIAFDELEARGFHERVVADPVRLISAATVLEAAMVIEARLGEAGGANLDL